MCSYRTHTVCCGGRDDQKVNERYLHFSYPSTGFMMTEVSSSIHTSYVAGVNPRRGGWGRLENRDTGSDTCFCHWDPPSPACSYHPWTSHKPVLYHLTWNQWSIQVSLEHAQCHWPFSPMTLLCVRAVLLSCFHKTSGTKICCHRALIRLDHKLC